jgi:hypothetical protein
LGSRSIKPDDLLLERLAMNQTPHLLVTLSDDLLKHLGKQAEEKHVPLRWLVAGLVCDSLSPGLNRIKSLMTDSKGVELS